MWSVNLLFFSVELSQHPLLRTYNLTQAMLFFVSWPFNESVRGRCKGLWPGGGIRDQLTCSHDACGGNLQHVLVAVRWVVGWSTRLPASICLCPRGGDGKKCCLVVRRRRVRKGGVLLLLFFHLVQEHGVLDLRAERTLNSQMGRGFSEVPNTPQAKFFKPIN